MEKTQKSRPALFRREGSTRTRRRGLIAAAAGFAVMGSILLMAAPADAAAPAYCPLHYTCMWGDSGYKTGSSYSAVIKFAAYIPILSQYTYTGTSTSGHDSVSSAYNNGATDTAYFYKNENGGGAEFTKSAGTGDSDFNNGSPAGSFNDTLDSAYFGAFN